MTAKPSGSRSLDILMNFEPRKQATRNCFPLKLYFGRPPFAFPFPNITSSSNFFQQVAQYQLELFSSLPKFAYTPAPHRQEDEKNVDNLLIAPRRLAAGLSGVRLVSSALRAGRRVEQRHHHHYQNLGSESGRGFERVGVGVFGSCPLLQRRGRRRALWYAVRRSRELFAREGGCMSALRIGRARALGLLRWRFRGAWNGFELLKRRCCRAVSEYVGAGLRLLWCLSGNIFVLGR